MKQKVLFFLALFFLFPTITEAVISGKIYEAIEDGKGGFINREFGDLQLKFKLSSGENFIVDTDREGNYKFDQDDTYCWKNCNIFPPIHIFETELIRDGVVIANLGYSLSNLHQIDEQSFYQISNVYTNTKTNVFDSYAIPENIINEKVPVLPTNEENANMVSVLWNGSILVGSTDIYTFFLNVSGGVVLIIDDKLLIDDWRGSLNKERNAVVELEQGIHNLSLIYYTSKDYGLPNLFWSSESFEKTILSEGNLLFKIGGSKISDLPLVKGALSKMSTLSLPNPSYYPTGTYWNYDAVEPWKRPLILVHGLHGSPTSSGYGYWYNIDSDFVSNGEDVWKFKYYPANYSNYFNGAILKNAISSILSNYNQLSDKRVDIVAHSMGGIVARVYTSNIALDSSLSIVPYNNDVRKIVTIGTPHSGSYLANRVLNHESLDFPCSLFIDYDPTEPAYKDLAVGSELTWELAKYGLNPNIEYLSIAGMDDDIVCYPYESSDSDSFVSATSASLLQFGIPLVLMNANHDNLRGDCRILPLYGGHPKCDCDGFWCPIAGEAVWDSHYQSDLISAFFDGASTTTLKSYLNHEVEKIEYYVDPTDPYADTNYPYTKGTVLVKFSDGSNPTSVQLHSKFTIGGSLYAFNLKKNPYSNNWFHFGTTSGWPDYGLTLPSGSYDIYKDGIDTGRDIQIKPLQTTVLEILPQDSDNDDIPDSQDSCPTTYGTYCRGCPVPTCPICTYGYCPPISGAPYCENSLPTAICGTQDCDYLDTQCRDYNDMSRYCNGAGSCQTPSCTSFSNKPSSTQCGNDYYEYSCYLGNNFGDDTAKRWVDYHCDGSGNCNPYIGSWVIDEQCSSDEYCYGSGITQNDADFYCKSPECDLDSDCGINGFIGQKYCQGQEIWDYYKRYICNNLGTVNAYCSYSQTAQRVEVCQAACISGVCISPLIIEGITVEVDGKDHSNLKNGEKIKRKAEPESDIDVIVEIKNGYEYEINLEDIEGEVIIEDIDDGDDLEESDDINEIKPGKSEYMKFSFDIPKEVKEDSYDIVIKIKAEDEEGNSYDAEYELILDVDKEKHNIEIEKAKLSPEILSCDDSSTLSISVLNMGSEDEDEARLTVQNSDLGIDFENVFELNEAPDDNARFKQSYRIPNNEKEGTYPIEVKVYSDLDDLMDDKIVTLTINECEEKECTDSDGKDYWKQGTVKTNKDDYRDYCREDGKLVEYSCEGNEMKKIIALCPYKCSKGACISEPAIQNSNLESTPAEKKTCFLWWCW